MAGQACANGLTPATSDGLEYNPVHPQSLQCLRADQVCRCMVQDETHTSSMSSHAMCVCDSTEQCIMIGSSKSLANPEQQLHLAQGITAFTAGMAYQQK